MTPFIQNKSIIDMVSKEDLPPESQISCDIYVSIILIVFVKKWVEIVLMSGWIPAPVIHCHYSQTIWTESNLY